MKTTKSLWIQVFGLCLLVCAPGCSSFSRDWRQAARQPADQRSVEGRWEGQWISEANGHHGNLRCLMTRENDSFYKARFRATYGKTLHLHFTYAATLGMHPHDIGWEFDGEADLGKLAGGTYYYEGRAATTNLVSTYRSKYDHGRFEMRRVE